MHREVLVVEGDAVDVEDDEPKDHQVELVGDQHFGHLLLVHYSDAGKNGGGRICLQGCQLVHLHGLHEPQPR